MIKYFRLSWSRNETLSHFCASLVLAVYVMWFCNFFIGSIGGIGLCLAFFGSYYVLRPTVQNGRRLSRQLGIGYRREIKYIIELYALSSIGIWLVVKIALIIGKFKGWANISGKALMDYLAGIYGRTVIERWSYVFTGLLLVSVLASFIPLLFIKVKKHWFAYIIADSAVYGTICAVIALIARNMKSGKGRSRSLCVLDNVLLTRMNRWQTVLPFIAVAALILLVQIWVSYRLVCRIYAPKKGRLNPPAEYFDMKRHHISYRAYWAIIASGIVVIGLFVFIFSPVEEMTEYNKVATCLTKDSVLGPIEYHKNIYIPNDEDYNLDDKGKALGYLAYKGQDCDSRFYHLAVANVLYTDRKETNNHLQMVGADYGSYAILDEVEKTDSWEMDSVFLIWDEDWASESAYSKDITGYTECEKSFVEVLESKFGKVELNPEDFKNYDAYFTIRSYSTMQSAVETETPMGNWVGCILVKNDRFYYGNYENQITGVLLQKLLSVLR